MTTFFMTAAVSVVLVIAAFALLGHMLRSRHSGIILAGPAADARRRNLGRIGQ